MEALSDGVSEDEKLISKIIENVQGIDILQAKEMLRRVFEGLRNEEASEVALSAKVPKLPKQVFPSRTEREHEISQKG
uniref:AlNc14C63G4528 protein n=1 Tax=Albugo laibachii Nc14 TaxID=890382 RepID=F0WD04_9STRA|nr:AlNc14C63G4528 [Albugo laibachii Nc14]|eukprot:CCA19076.1 AlNc14C63G4528 [Albugo laibachii Nc14]